MGLDVAEISRIRDSMPQANAAQYVAARFAAKEACAKALGTGFAGGVTLQNIEVRSLPSGAPTLVLTGRAKELAETMGATRLHLSLTHGRDVAAAVVVLEGPPL